MEERNFPNIVSFVIRFVQEQPSQVPGEVAFRGSIRHIQTDQEIAFTCWEDATAFIQKFIPIGENFDRR